MSNFMRILVFFDLPVKQKSERKEYMRFRKFLLNDGYDMLQFSVYCRICNGNEGTKKHVDRLKYNIPTKGSIRTLTVTDKQYAKMEFLVGKPTQTEKKATSAQLTLF
ncbi:CRISPR-associated endonuclease Cas2 [Bacillus thuringiensis]|uniref:CRISPR-associated endoribonuclease Cas2 n=2 Tax=Bacillus thuringiensis TaxID=1428 RepID=A0AAW9GTT4_BACTU|nr:CRISPR-associated endonuclease Cas2 [Bacillus thuringiensis]MDY0855076.1 CRISPR-associated endonuclease Cas2 [Bacillus thuringiensis]